MAEREVERVAGVKVLMSHHAVSKSADSGAGVSTGLNEPCYGDRAGAFSTLRCKECGEPQRAID